MDRLIIAIIETSAALLFFYSVYALWLKKLTFFKENRFYLLLTAMASLFIPWLNFTLPAKSANTIIIYNLLDTISVSANGYEQNLVQKLSAWQWLGVVYVLGVICMFILFIVRIVKISKINKTGAVKVEATNVSNVKFVDAEIVPFSFLNKIYINPQNLSQKQLTDIIAHENVHVSQQHTYDCLFYELLIVFFWFNPIVYKYRKAAKEIHEYLADEGAIRTGIESQAYQKLLFEQATGVSMLKLANSFNYSLIKNRLVMLTKIRSNKVAKVRLLMAVPVLLIVLVVFACNESVRNEVEPEIRSHVDANGNEIESMVYFTVEEMPMFPGGDMELRKYIAKNVVYPKLAKETGTQGRIFIQFVVNEEGKVEQVKNVGEKFREGESEVGEVAVVGYGETGGDKQAAYDELIKEAIRVIESLPDWKPGKQDGENVKVSFTVPINFQLN